MSVTRIAASDFSAYLGCAVYQTDTANTVALWTDPATVPLGLIDAITEETPTQLVIATHGDRSRYRTAAGGVAVESTLLTTVGAGGRLTAADVGEYHVAVNLHAKDAAEGDLCECIVNIGQNSVEAAE